jgi:hypothetical protein
MDNSAEADSPGQEGSPAAEDTDPVGTVLAAEDIDPGKADTGLAEGGIVPVAEGTAPEDTAAPVDTAVAAADRVVDLAAVETGPAQRRE